MYRAKFLAAGSVSAAVGLGLLAGLANSSSLYPTLHAWFTQLEAELIPLLDTWLATVLAELAALGITLNSKDIVMGLLVIAAVMLVLALMQLLWWLTRATLERLTTAQQARRVAKFNRCRPGAVLENGRWVLRR